MTHPPITDEMVERKAKELACMHGGKIVWKRPGGESWTNAYMILTSEKRWSYPWGLHTSDLLATYMEYHWREFIDQARAALEAALSGKEE